MTGTQCLSYDVDDKGHDGAQVGKDHQDSTSDGVPTNQIFSQSLEKISIFSHFRANIG